MLTKIHVGPRVPLCRRTQAILRPLVSLPDEPEPPAETDVTLSKADIIEYIDETVDAVFDGVLTQARNENEQSIIRIAGFSGDRLACKLFFIVDVVSIDTDMRDIVRKAAMQGDSTPFMRYILGKLPAEEIEMINNLGSAGAWGKDADLIEWYQTAPYIFPNSVIPVDRLCIGEMSSNVDCLFHGEGNLITIAPPGSGKGQCMVIPNLLTYVGGTFTLDIKGENYEHAHQRRADITRKWGMPDEGEELPPIIRFTPGDPENSAKWNPIDHLRDTVFDLWEDARALADLLIVPQSGDYFEERGRDLVGGLLQFIKLCPDYEPNMQSVCSLLWRDKEGLQMLWDEMKNLGNQSIAEVASSFESTADKELSGVLNSARRSLEIWRSPRVSWITDTTTEGWNAAYLRKGGSVFLNIPQGKVGMYASVIRVLCGQHMYGLMEDRENVAQWPITFFLDEFPQLGYMKVFEDAADVGRDRKIRQWFICQNIGQLKERYRNWEGLMSSCNFQMFMNINDQDSANYVVQRLGEAGGSVLDSRKRPLASASDLFGPEYKDKIVVIPRSMKPMKLKKLWLSDTQALIDMLPLDVQSKYQDN
jgi:type IV secretion system protein VirD4